MLIVKRKVQLETNVWLGQKNNTVIRLPHKWYAGNNYT